MPSLTISKISCYRTEDIDEKDELRCRIIIDKAKKHELRHTMFAGDNWTLNRNYTYHSTITFELWEDDDDSQKLLGTTTFGRDSKGGRGRYKKDKAIYAVFFDIVEASEPATEKPMPVQAKVKKKGKVKVRKAKKGKAKKNQPKEVKYEDSAVTQQEVTVEGAFPKVNFKKWFRPSEHGFKFGNAFKLDLPIKLPFIEKFASSYGLCGGMSLMAADCYTHGISMPAVGKAPETGSKLYSYILNRQLDTFGARFKYLIKFFKWWRMYSTFETQQATLKEWTKLKKRIDEGKPTPLGLVYVDEQTGRLWDNHQVLGYDYKQISSTEIHIYIYDPNYPKRDDVFIKAKLDTSQTNKKNVQRLICDEHIPNLRTKTVRGFFIIPVKTRKPDFA
ncbi:MAG: hypothetical protein ACPG5B_07990 [Chitinophagales bacterium]